MTEDTRYAGQDRFLRGLKFQRKDWKSYRPENDHDHCEFCWDKFSNEPDSLHTGWGTTDNYHWVCDQCFKDFKDRIGMIAEVAVREPKN